MAQRLDEPDHLGCARHVRILEKALPYALARGRWLAGCSRPRDVEARAYVLQRGRVGKAHDTQLTDLDVPVEDFAVGVHAHHRFGEKLDLAADAHDGQPGGADQARALVYAEVAAPRVDRPLRAAQLEETVAFD